MANATIAPLPNVRPLGGIEKRTNAGKYETRIHNAIFSQHAAPEDYAKHLTCMNTGRSADDETARLGKEIDRLRSDLLSAQHDLASMQAVNRTQAGTGYSPSRHFVLTPCDDAGEFEIAICNAFAQEGAAADIACRKLAHMADGRIARAQLKLTEANAEIARLARELEFAQAANRKHVRDLTDALEENARLRSGGLAIAL